MKEAHKTRELFSALMLRRRIATLGTRRLSPRLGLACLLPLLLACGDPCATVGSVEILTRAAAEPGAVRTESGLVFLQLRPG